MPLVSPTVWFADGEWVAPPVFMASWRVSVNILYFSAPLVPIITSWDVSWSEPVRQKRGLAPYLHPFSIYDETQQFPEVIKIDKWVNTTDEILPPRRKAGLLTAQYPYFTIDTRQLTLKETVTVDRWLQAWSRPTVLRKIGFQPWGPQVFAVLTQAPPYAETVSLDRWMLPLSSPARLDRALLVPASQLVTVIGKPVVIQTFGSIKATESLDVALFNSTVSARVANAAVSIIEITPTGSVVSVAERGFQIRIS